MRSRRAAGDLGEDLACHYLKKQGYTILARNVVRPGGEVDIIAREGRVYVFVEVKTRSSTRYGTPLEAIDAGKRRRVVRVAERWLAEEGLTDVPVRFDAVAVTDTGCELVRAAFDASDMI